MKLAKWGNSYGIRLPAVMIKNANLKEGDSINVQFRGENVLEISRDRTKQEALEVIRKLRRSLPDGFKFDREESHDRGYMKKLRVKP
jgi:antitoxin MazE